MKTPFIFLITLTLAASQLMAGGKWTHNTYPGPGHTEHPGPWGPGQGSDRTEWVAGFGVNPVNPDFMLMTTDMSGLSYTTDGKEFLPAQIPVRHGHSIAFHPTDGQTGYALMSDPTGLNKDGWWRTRDGGRAWEFMMETESVRRSKRRLVVDPARPGHIYVAAPNGLWSSTDDGATWKQAALAKTPVVSLAITQDGSSLYVLTGGGDRPGDLHRMDNGDLSTLRKIRDGVTELDVHPTDPERGYLVDGKRLFAFSQRGETLSEPLHEDTEVGLNFVRVNPSNPEHLIAYAWGGLHRRPFHFSADGGKTWDRWVVRDGWCGSLVDYAPLNHASPGYHLDAQEMMFEGDRELVSFVPGAKSSVVMWATNYIKGPVRSDDYGATFRPFGHGGSFKASADAAVGGSAEVMAVARNEYGFVVTRDGGRTWRGYGRNNVPLFRMEDGKPLWRFRSGWGIAFDPRDDRTMIGTYGWEKMRVVRTQDAGETWEILAEVPTPAVRNEDYELFWHPQKPEIIYTAGHRSRDGGSTWEPLQRPVHAMSPANGDLLLSRPDRAKGFLSIDGGDTWVTLPDFPAADQMTPGADALSLDPSPEHDPAKGGMPRVLAGGRNGVLEFTAEAKDGSKGSWRLLTEGIRAEDNFTPTIWFRSVAFDPRPGESKRVYLLAGHTGKGQGTMYRRQYYGSTDGGRSWSQIVGQDYPGLPEIMSGSNGLVCPHTGRLHLLNFNGNYTLEGQ